MCNWLRFRVLKILLKTLPRLPPVAELNQYEMVFTGLTSPKNSSELIELSSMKTLRFNFTSLYEGWYIPPTISAVVNATNRTTQTKGNKTFILHNLMRIKQISYEKFKLLSQLAFRILTNAKIRHFLWYCLPSWKILDNSTNVKSDF